MTYWVEPLAFFASLREDASMWRHWIIRSIFILPALLFAGGWLWSATHWCHVAYGHDRRYVWCRSDQGVLRLGLLWGVGMPDGWDAGVEPIEPRYWPTADPNVPSFLGFGLKHDGAPGWHTYTVKTPYWFLLLASSAIFFLVWRKTRPSKPAGAFPVEIINPK